MAKMTEAQRRVLELVRVGYPDEGGGSYAAHHMNGIDQRVADRLGKMGLLVGDFINEARTWFEWKLTPAGRAALSTPTRTAGT